ncbi:hypothetical protein NDU88_001089 [Pleurodeles waltl]|uniref:DNA endonuclease Ctp1 N-terminal domain-containing protein n=1 Tax=Pleurodeles waltl TaxID=8319 RepID=A0AAV7P639_PLEWA|nr:hypothetical protein NDU88_001089 [Pleurodeles waltl]
METFSEAWNKLKDLHEKEVIGLQAKLAELTMEKCRDTQRIEELFAKNHLLREQQKVLNENVKVLENRLRAGLCDRCTVTQEMAKKKQHEFESTHFQSLQHISSLTNEINGLKEENKTLMEELNMLKNPDDRTKTQPVVLPETPSTPNSPLPLASPGTLKKSLEKSPSKECEEREDGPCPNLAEEKSVPRLSPGPRASPAVMATSDRRLYELNPQRISNQLHGTIAVVRPGSRPCQNERSSEGLTQMQCKATTPNYHTDADTHCRESWERRSHYESLKQSSRDDHFYRFNQHLARHRTAMRSHAITMDSIARLSSHVPKSREAEPVRKHSQDDWDERSPVVGRVVYLSEQDLKGRLSILEQQERLQYFRVRKQQQLQWARMESPKDSGLPQPSHNQQVMGAERVQCRDPKNEELRSPYTCDQQDRNQHLRNSKKPETTWASVSAPPDKPLDLSDYGRGRDSQGSPENSWPKLCQPEPSRQSPACKEGSSPLETVTSPLNKLDNNVGSQCSRIPLSMMSDNHYQRENDTSQVMAEDRDCESSLDWKSLPQGNDTRQVASCTRDETSGIRMTFSVRRQNPDLEPDEEDGELPKGESDESESSDNEMNIQYDTERKCQTQVEEGKYFCVKDKAQGTAKKRKRGHDPWTRAHRRFTKGRKKGKDLQSQPATEEMDNSTSSSNDVFGGT